MAEVHVLIPDRFGLALVEVHQLVAYLDDGDDLETAITNASMDSLDRGRDGTLAAMDEHVARIRALNETGDGAAYWKLGE